MASSCAIDSRVKQQERQQAPLASDYNLNGIAGLKHVCPERVALIVRSPRGSGTEAAVGRPVVLSAPEAG
jgi:hypothetical protein